MTQILNFTFSTKRTSKLKNYRNIHTKINKQQTSKYVIEKNENECNKTFEYSKNGILLKVRIINTKIPV